MADIPLLVDRGPDPITPVDSINSFILNLEKGVKPALVLSHHKNQIRSLDLNSDLLATGSGDKTMALWRLSTQTLLATFNFENWVIALAFTKDGKKLIGSSNNGLLRFFSTEDFRELFSFRTHEENIFCITVTQDYVITGSIDKTAKLWNLETHKEEHSFVGHTEGIYCMTVNQDGSELYTGSRDYSIKVWSITRRVLEYTLVGHAHWLYSVSLSHDGKLLVSGSEDKTVRVWNLLERTQKFVLNGHIHTVTAAVFTYDNKFIVSSSDSILKVWDTNEQREVFTLPCHKSFVRCLATTKDRKYIISGADDFLIKAWDISDKSEDYALLGHTSTVSCMAVYGDLLVSGSEDKSLKLWNYKNKELLNTSLIHKDRIFSVSFSFDGTKIASCSADRTIIIWCLKTQTQKCITGYDRWIRCILWKNDGEINSKYLYSGSDDNLVYITNVDDGFIEYKLKGHTNAIYCLAMSSDNLRLFSGASDNTIIIWDTNSRIPLFTLFGHSSTVTGLAFDLAGSRLVSACSDSTLKVWNLELKREEFTLLGHEQSITGISLDLATGLIYTSSEDFSMKAWNIEEKRIEFSIAGCSSLTSICANSNIIFTGSKDKSIKVWEFPQLNSEDELYLPYVSKFDFTTMVCGFNSPEINLNSFQSSLPLGRNQYTLAHLFAHQGKENQLEKILALRPLLTRDKHGNSPLYYSLNKQSQLCTDLILQYLIDASKFPENYLNSAYAFRSDLYPLISNSSDLLDEFLSGLMIVQTKCFAQPAENLAIVRRAPIQKAFVEDFTLAKNTESDAKKSVKEPLLQFHTTGFELPEVLGSEESISFAKALLECSNKKIFESTLVQYYIRSKWNAMWYGAFLHTLLLWGNLVIILLLVTSDLFLIPIQIVFIIFNVVLLLVEIIQLTNASFLEYFSSFWNYIDLVRVILCGVWLGLRYNDINVSLITWSMIFINFAKGVTGFRAFDKTRFYVRLFFKSFIDISSFLIIFFYSTLSFGLLFTSNKNLSGEEILKYLWISPFDLNLGNFDTHDKLTLDYLGFFLASLVNVIVMLSLLISILGDSFDRFMIEAVQIDHIEMAEVVYELELLMFWRKKSNRSSYMQICDTLHMSYGSNDWEGTTKALESSINKMLIKRLKPIEDGMDERHEKVLENVFAVENVMNTNGEKLVKLEQKIQGLDEKMNLILSILGK